MNSASIFWMQLAISVVLCTVIVNWYVRPWLSRLPDSSSLTLLLWVHVPRYVGMTLFVAGMVDSKLPGEYIAGSAYGDLLEAFLAFVAILGLRKNWGLAIPLVWVANSWGFLDLLNGIRSVIQSNVPTYNLATFWYVYILYAPIVIVSHVMIFSVLLGAKSRKASA